MEFMINEEGCKVVDKQLTPDVNQVVQPQHSNLIGDRSNNLEEDISKDLIAVNWEIVVEPAQACFKKSMPVVVHGEV